MSKKTQKNKPIDANVMYEKTQCTTEDVQKAKRLLKKKESNRKKFIRIFFPILGGAALVTGITLGCVYGCHKTPDWQKYFDDPGEQVRHQTASAVGEEVTYEFNLKEAVPTGQKVTGDVEVVRTSHGDDVVAEVSDFNIDAGGQTATFTAKITQVPSTNKTTTYWADIEAEVKCEMADDSGQIFWTTTIQDMRVQVEVGDTPEPTYDEVINLEYENESLSITKTLESGKTYKIVADFTPWTTVDPELRPFRLDFNKSPHILTPNYTIKGVMQGSTQYTEADNLDALDDGINLYFKNTALNNYLHFKVGSFAETKVVNLYLTFNETYTDAELDLGQPK